MVALEDKSNERYNLRSRREENQQGEKGPWGRLAIDLVRNPTPSLSSLHHPHKKTLKEVQNGK